MPPSLLRPLCWVLLAGTWALDVLTPQLFIAAVFFNVPIALSSLVLDARLTYWLVVFALTADVSAGYWDGVLDHHHWVRMAAINRAVAAFSFLLVGVLSIAAQRSARHAGELSERSERETRGRLVRRAIERMRETISVELVERSLVREAREALECDAVWYWTRATPATVYRCDETGEVTQDRERLAAPIASLVQRVMDADTVVRVAAGDPIGRLVLDTLGLSALWAIAIAEHGKLFGVLMIGCHAAVGDTIPPRAEMLRFYAEQAATALAQAELFEELARRNDALGQANAALRERSDVIRDIVYALSHDLRTPLAAASMTMHQALEGRYGELPAAYRAMLERSVRSNDELRRLAETLLLVSRYESGEASHHRERVELHAVAREVEHELEPLWRAKGVRLQVEGAEVAVLADRGELRRAVVNLVANAVHWTPADGAIVIRTARAGEHGCVVVEDTGFGVPANLREHLFQRLGQGSRNGAGSGLGLYLVRRIAEGHGGRVAYAPREGGGSVFRLELPIAEPER